MKHFGKSIAEDVCLHIAEKKQENTRKHNSTLASPHSHLLLTIFLPTSRYFINQRTSSAQVQPKFRGVGFQTWLQATTQEGMFWLSVDMFNIHYPIIFISCFWLALGSKRLRCSIIRANDSSGVRSHSHASLPNRCSGVLSNAQPQPYCLPCLSCG